MRAVKERVPSLHWFRFMMNPSLTIEAKIAAKAKETPARETFSARMFVLLAGVVLFGFFVKVVVGAETFFYRDYGAQVYPAIFYLRQSLLHGQLPLWNPYVHCGVPFMAQWGSWYPGLLLSPLFPMPWFLNVFNLVHLLWGGCGMYWLCRRWGQSGFAASFAGLAYVFSGISLSCLMWASYTASLSWLPWVAGLTMAAWKHGGKFLTLAALASAMQVLAGAPEITLLFWLLLGALWLIEVLRKETPCWPSLGRLIGIVALAGGMTMVQMLPFFDLLSHSQRDRQYGGDAWAMPGWGWANLIVPLFHCYQAPQGPWFQPWQDLMSSYYLGLTVMALAITGVWTTRNPKYRVVGLAALLCWIFALGSQGYLLDLAKRIFPLIGIARFPVKFAVLPAFLVPVLAAAAVDKLLSSDHRPTKVLITVGSGLLVVMAFLLWFARAYPFPLDNWKATATNAIWRAVLMLVALLGLGWAGKALPGTAQSCVLLAVLAIVPIDALTHSPKIFPTVPAGNLAPGMWTAGGNPEPPRLGEGRIMLSPEAEQQLTFSHIPDVAADFTTKRLGEWYNLNLLDEIPKVNGAIVLQPREFDILEKYLYYTAGAHTGRGLLDFLSVRWTSSADNPTQWTGRTNYLGMLTGGQRPVFIPDSQARAAITAKDFDPRAVVYLPESSRGSVQVSQKTDCTVTDVRVSSARIEATARASEPSLIVLSQSFYHLWQAFVDGHPTPLLRANLAFQALQIPAGSHQVTLVYRDRNLWVGAVISLCSLAGCVWLWVRKEKAMGALGKREG